MTTASDRELLDAARAGDEPALDALLSRYQSRVYRFGMKMCRDPEDAADVLQETLLAAARSLRDFRGASSLSTWLYTITRSFCIKKRRRSKFAPEAEVSLEAEEAARELPDPGRSPEDALESRRIEEALETAIRGLDPEYREVLVLRDIEGLTAPEVSEVTGISVEAVKSRLHRARLAVRARLAPLLGIHPARPAGGVPPCPDVLLEAFTRHLEGDLGPDDCAEMERHLASCGRCQGLCESLRGTLRLCRSLPEPEVPADLRDAVRAGIRDLLARRA